MSTDILEETHIMGDDTHCIRIHADDCDALSARHIKHVAFVDAATPYKVVRTHLTGAFMQVCLGGEGRTLLDGRWHTHRAGMVSFAPAHVLHAFHAMPGTRWQLCWVRFMPSSSRSVAEAMAPGIMPADGHALKHAILGLSHEIQGHADPGACAMWVDIIERYVARMIDPWRREPRLTSLWNTVMTDLSRDWSLDELAELASISPEHLRRLCQKSLGRSPGKQLLSLRIAQAAHQLATTPEKVEVIARNVGYANPFTFSNTFKRMTGFRPSEFRSKPRDLASHGSDSQP